MSASVVKTGDASFSLVVKSELGANKKINMSAQDSNNSNGLGADNEIAAISYTTPSNSTHAAKQVVAGADALSLLMESRSLGLQTLSQI